MEPSPLWHSEDIFSHFINLSLPMPTTRSYYIILLCPQDLEYCIEKLADSVTGISSVSITELLLLTKHLEQSLPTGNRQQSSSIMECHNSGNREKYSINLRQGIWVNIFSDSKRYATKKGRKRALQLEEICRLENTSTWKYKRIMLMFDEAIHSPVGDLISVPKSNN